jgi:hypothetical protein
MTTASVKYNVTRVTLDKPYVPFKCVNVTQIELETKIVPKCVNVTQQDCVTKWELNTRGEKVSLYFSRLLGLIEVFWNFLHWPNLNYKENVYYPVCQGSKPGSQPA